MPKTPPKEAAKRKEKDQIGVDTKDIALIDQERKKKRAAVKEAQENQLHKVQERSTAKKR